MTKALVPSNHRLREHALAEALTPLKAIDPVSIETVWHAWRSPAALLPFLAYAVSVDFWDDSWDEIRKRQVIADSPAYHRRKGTAKAVWDAARATGRETMIVEWHNFMPERRRGTFRVTLELRDGEAAIEAEEIALVRRLIASAKPKSRAFSLEIARTIRLGVGLSTGVMPKSRITLAVPPDDILVSFTPSISLRVASGVTLEAA